jgi:protein-tyrosine phosphatase
VTLLEREESEEYADLTRRIVGLLRRGKTVVVHCRDDLGRCAIADLGSSPV